MAVPDDAGGCVSKAGRSEGAACSSRYQTCSHMAYTQGIELLKADPACSSPYQNVPTSVANLIPANFIIIKFVMHHSFFLLPNQWIHLVTGNVLICSNKKQTILIRNSQKWTDFFHIQVVMNCDTDPGRKFLIRQKRSGSRSATLVPSWPTIGQSTDTALQVGTACSSL